MVKAFLNAAVDAAFIIACMTVVYGALWIVFGA